MRISSSIFLICFSLPFSLQGLAQSSIDDVIKLCDSNKNAAACFYVGAMYEGGQQGLAADPVKANSYYERACSANHDKACFNLGNNYLAERGIPENLPPKEAGKYFSKGTKLWKKSCDLGNYRACIEYGNYIVRFANGPKPAVQVYEKACAIGSAEGCKLAANIYEAGAGRGDGVVVKDAAKAVNLNDQAAGIVRKDNIFNGLVASADKNLFTEIVNQDGVIKFKLNNVSTRWEAHLKGETLSLSHTMTGFPDSPAFRNLVIEQTGILNSTFFIAKFPGKEEEYFAISNTFSIDGKNNKDNFHILATQGYSDLNSFMTAFSALQK